MLMNIDSHMICYDSNLLHNIDDTIVYTPSVAWYGIVDYYDYRSVV